MSKQKIMHCLIWMRFSTFPFTGAFWLLSHVIYHKLTKVLYEVLLFQVEWCVTICFLSFNNWGLNFLQNKYSQSSQIYLYQKNWWKKVFTFQSCKFLNNKLTKSLILPDCQVPNSFFCILYSSATHHTA